MSSSSSPPPPEQGNPGSLPPCTVEEVNAHLAALPQQKRERVTNLLRDVGEGDFWTKTRYVQVIRMVAMKDVHNVKQMDTAATLGVSNGLVTRYKQYFEEHPDEEIRPPPGRQSELSDVSPELENFIAAETGADRAVTMSVVMAFLTDRITTPLTRGTVWRFMDRHGYAYKSAVATDAHRVTVTRNDITTFYTRTLPEAVNGTHPSLVFNVDEMGAEMFADRKRVFVFVPAQDVQRAGPLTVGVSRTTRRCTLVGCISADGTTLLPTIITKTVTISSEVFAEGGYTPDTLKICSTDNSFINNDVFGEWLCDVLLPEIERRRAPLHQKLGDYNNRAVLILDGCSCHTMEPFVELLRRHNVVMLFLVPHSSHMCQALDVGIFGGVKNLIRGDNKCVIKLNELDRAMAEQTEAETHNEEVPPERGRLLAEYVLRILRSFEQATVHDRVVSAFAQVGIRSKLLERRNPYSRVTYTDPSTARVVVSKFGVIPLPEEHQVDASPAWQLKIRDLNSNNQSELALAMRQELSSIWTELSERAQHGYVKRRTDQKGK